MPSNRTENSLYLGLRQKVVIVLIAVLSISLGLTGWYSLQQQEKNILEQTQQRGEDLARSTAQSLVYNVIGYDYHAIQLLLEEIVKSRDINYAKVINTRGNIMGEAGFLPKDTKPWTIFKRNIEFDKDSLGELTLTLDNANIVKQITKQRDSIIQREIFLIFLITIGEFLALSYIIIRPVVKISNALDKNIDENGHINKDMPQLSNDEFGRLSNQFNRMRKQLNSLTDKLHSKVNHANLEVQEQNEKLRQQSNELKSINLKLETLTITDPLTGLYNRRHFDTLIESELTYAIQHSEYLSIVIIDLDKFKSINDTYGHATGDTVLCTIADFLKKNVRKSDTPCRIGGEEFALLCRHTSISDSKIVIEKLRKKLACEEIKLDGDVNKVTASFGIMTIPSDMIKINSTKEFYSCADQAMYYSKEHGRNQVTHYNSIMDQTTT